MLSESTFYGNPQDLGGSVGASGIINPLLARVWYIQPTASSVLTLPSARILRPGYPTIVFNNGSNNVVIKDNRVGTLLTLTPNNAGFLALKDNSSVAGSWTTWQTSFTSAAG